MPSIAPPKSGIHSASAKNAKGNIHSTGEIKAVLNNNNRKATINIKASL